ncbi:MAG: protein-glutamate O-methyltransferase CheR [Gammaproteobacteria bacterium]|nr:protein-glutamate O-methyltransferase CheR [Gammaproteobacteria bacterium]
MAKEFVFTRDDFKEIQKVVAASSGINLGDHKFEMVYGRIARRLRATGLRTVKDYLSLIENNNLENIQFINAITTNLTYFFRENHHFEFLRKTVIPELVSKHTNDKRVRIWSAGCSTGEEPYSIALTLDEFLRKYATWDTKILATDLDTQVLEKARVGLYNDERVQSLSGDVKKNLFEMTKNGFRVKDRHRKTIFFKQLNLMHSWPMKGKFDVIFCRNVLIYFERSVQQALIDKFRQVLQPKGLLILGHSESIGAQAQHFEPLGKTIFRRKV